MSDFISDFWGFLKVRKKFWLAPIVVLLLLLAILIAFSQGAALSPFLYTVF